MQFKVPQFIEREAKIMGPLTFKQFLFIGGGGIIVFILYTLLSQINMTVFIIMTIIVGVISFAFAFLKFEGHPLLNAFVGLTGFISTPKIYLWEKKEFLPKIKKESPEKKENELIGEIKISSQGKLKNLSNEIELK